MLYEKPLVVDLNAQARVAVGINSFSCMAGTSPGGNGWCVSGTAGTDIGNPCVVGPGATSFMGDPICYSGGAASGSFCEAGTGGTDLLDDCTVGSSNV